MIQMKHKNDNLNYVSFTINRDVLLAKTFKVLKLIEKTWVNWQYQWCKVKNDKHIHISTCLFHFVAMYVKQKQITAIKIGAALPVYSCFKIHRYNYLPVILYILWIRILLWFSWIIIIWRLSGNITDLTKC